MTRRMATPQPIRAVPPVRFEDHQCLGCASIALQVALGVVLVYVLLALIGTGPW